jgi:adenine-specific DNA-methyltransferase
MSNDPDRFTQAFQQVQALAATFDANKAHYLSPGYQEQEARQDFIDKFWVALGWDVTHTTQTNPYAQEVKVERGVTMSEGRKRADYAFYLGPDFKNPRFFVEAKKPSVEIANRDSYFQALRYGWNGGTPLAVLTDFEQFHVLDCRARPDVDTALARALQKYHYTEYADRDKFGAIYWLFSREAVAAGGLEKYVAERMPKAGGKFLQRGLFHGGHQGIDESFLRELDEYRGTLARAFHAANSALDSETLTEATQRVLDRLVFMRFLEDKLIEPEPMVAHFGDKGTAWAGFLAVSRRLDTIYNGNIFKPHLIDKPTFHAPDSVFGQVCSDLSSEQSPYLFSLIPIHILGSIYERFLGKVIVVDGGAARVEEKPEVRKAGGVYYTPDYIVRYIVEQTVGAQIAGRTPAEIAGLRFADIACGSGSFLLGVYDCLLRYHTAYYNARAKGRASEAQKAGCERREGVWHLSLWQKRQILLDNVWGVDIDAQAVEVAQMSLYLKLLEEETTATAHDQNVLHGAILPTLGKNIVFGNSLIGTDILQDTLFEPAEERKLNPLDFKQAFPQIMKNGGFDAVVGNPPYGQVFDKRQLEYLDANYKAIEGRSDFYELFIERAIALCKEAGFLGYIVPSPLLTNLYTRKLRNHLLSNYTIGEITNFGMDVFSEPTVHTCIVILQNRKPTDNSIKIRKQVTSPEELSNEYDYDVPQEAIGRNANNSIDIFVDPINSTLLQKLSQSSVPLSEICYIRQCIKTGDDKTYVIASGNSPGSEWKPSLRGKSIGRYVTLEKNIWIKYGDWLARNWKNTSFYETPKIAIRETGNRIVATLDLENRYFLSSLYAIYQINPDLPLSLKYLLSLINSSLASYFVRVVALELTKGAFTKLRTNQLGRLPIRRIDFSDPADKARHDKMVGMVEQMLTAKKELAGALTDRDTEYWQRRCDGLDRQIDELVYELYGLTEEEIGLVEGAGAA